VTKVVSYNGAHTVTWTAVGFAGWGGRSAIRRPVGLANMMSLVDETKKFVLLKSAEFSHSNIPKYPVNATKKKARRKGYPG